MENVRLQNLVLEYEEELRLRDVEDAADKAQTAEMLASKDRQIAEQAALIESQKKDIERITADRDQERDSRIKAEDEKKALIIQLNQQKQDHEEEMKELLPAKEMLKEAEKNNVDCQAVIKMMLNRMKQEPVPVVPLTMLDKRNKGVSAEVHTRYYEQTKLDFDKHNQQYEPISYVQLPHAVHDRYLIVDDDVWLLGTSVKDMGRGLCTIIKVGFTPEEVIEKLE